MLSSDDRDWLEDKFNRVHARIDAVEQALDRKGSDIHRIDRDMIRLATVGNEAVERHEDKHHNPAKTWGIVSAIVGVAAALIEGIKWLLRREV